MVCENQKDLRDRKAVARALKTSVMSKQYGHEDFLAKLLADACGKIYLIFLLLTHYM